MQTIQQLASRWAGLLLTSTVVALWLAGVVSAVRGGADPGFVRPHIAWAYPTGEVVRISGIITAEAAFLYLILRPRSFTRQPRRALLALAVFAPLLTVEIINSRTDQPGYQYSHGFFVAWVVAFLIITYALSRRIFRPQPLTPRHDAA